MPFVPTLQNISQYHAGEADKKGVDFVTDLPFEPIRISGLEGRLAQVFVNLLSNAISFCEDGDAVRLWTRLRENRVLIVVDPGVGELIERHFNSPEEGPLPGLEEVDVHAVIQEVPRGLGDAVEQSAGETVVRTLEQGSGRPAMSMS